MKLNLDNETICIQVDFSENFHIDVQDAIQSSFYSKDSVSLFTCYIWYLNGGYSRVYVSDDLSHDKYYIDAALDHLFGDLRDKFQHLKRVHIFSDGAAQQFKQRFLFRNLCRLSEKFKVVTATQVPSIFIDILHCLDRIILALLSHISWERRRGWRWWYNQTSCLYGNIKWTWM